MEHYLERSRVWTAYFILMAMARSPMATRAAFTDGSWTPRRRCSAPSEGSRDLYVSKWRSRDQQFAWLNVGLLG
jgi:hypothetical protein